MKLTLFALTSLFAVLVSAEPKVTTNFFSEKLFTPKAQSAEQKPNLVEAVCRVKAKEAAAHAFRDCLLDDKSAQVQEMKKSAAAKVRSRKQAKPVVQKAEPKAEASEKRQVSKGEVYKDQTTTVDVRTDKEDIAKEAFEASVAKPVGTIIRKERMKPAMLVEDDTEIPEPTTMEEDPE